MSSAPRTLAQAGGGLLSETCALKVRRILRFFFFSLAAESIVYIMLLCIKAREGVLFAGAM
jgi:hypothetical protein